MAVLLNGSRIVSCSKEDSIEKLTPREKECLYWTSQGKTIEEIALIFNISKCTVRNHLYSIKNKFGVFKITHAIYIAIKKGLI